MFSAEHVDQIQIATPCTASWDAMRGDDKVRHCDSCRKNVYNLSALTRPQIVDLVRRTEGKFCGRFFRRTDGTMLTVDCPVGVRERARRAAKRLYAFAAFAFVALISGVSGFVTGQKPVCVKRPLPIVDVVDSLPKPGGIAIPDEMLGGASLPPPALVGDVVMPMGEIEAPEIKGRVKLPMVR